MTQSAEPVRTRSRGPAKSRIGARRRPVARQSYLFAEAVPECTRPIIIDYFAGGGGVSHGIEQALGRSPDVAIDHCAQAIAMHRINHPASEHLCVDVFDVDPVLHIPPGRVKFGWLSPSCFPAGTMILTRDGHRPVEDIRVGEEVLTHKGRWRKVTATMSTVRPLIALRGYGHPCLRVSAEHPFLTKHRTRVWNNTRRQYDRAFGDAAWVQAAKLTKSHYWASPASFPEAAPPDVPVFRNRRTTIDDDFMWLVGRYIADGWTRLTKQRAELSIACGMRKVDEFRQRVSKTQCSGRRAGSDELSWSERSGTGLIRFDTNHRGIVTWLRDHFGSGAASKRIPGWALGMSESLRRSLLDGYLAGDGYRNSSQGNPLVELTTVSKALAFGIKALAASLGYSPMVYLDENQRSVIEGRNVVVRPAWIVRWREVIAPGREQAFVEDGLHWSAIKSVVATDTEAEVFNLSVEEDESYVADGIVVHNCTHFAHARGSRPVTKQMRGLAWVGLRLAAKRKPDILFYENVREFLTWGPVRRGRPVRSKAGQTFRVFVAQLESLGYVVEWRVLDAANYGAPTHRRRLILIARCDGLPIVWPEPTHGPGRTHLYRTAAECIDWSLPSTSIFDRKRPLADATMRRIAEGLRRFVLENPKPYIVPSGDTAQAPTLIQTGYGERKGQTPRALDLHQPLGTIVACGAKHAPVSAFLAKHYKGVVGHGVDRPIGTITAKDHHSLVEVQLEPGQDKSDRVAAFITTYYGQSVGQSLREPLATIVTKARFGLVTVDINGETYAVTDIRLRMLSPKELARCQGFDESYRLIGTQAEQIERIGNSVSPPLVRAIIAANVSRDDVAVAA